MKLRTLAVFALVGAVATGAQADAATCAASYPERIAGVKQAIIEWDAYTKERSKHLKALDFFDAHCRFLTELEVAIRKLNDPNTIVCKTEKGRPKDVTAEVITGYHLAASPQSFVEEHGFENHRCAAYDAAERLALVLPEDLNIGEQQELLCWGRDTPSCASSLAALEVARAKGKLPPSRLHGAPAPSAQAGER